MKIALTGHRPQRLFGNNLKNSKWQAVADWIKKTLLEQKCTEAFSGMAKGSDLLYALAVKELNESWRKIKLTLVFPCENYGSNSPDKRYLGWREEVINVATEKIYIHKEYTKTADNDRDKYMVDNCDILIAIFDGIEVGGVYETIKYAESIGKKIIYCPRELLEK